MKAHEHVGSSVRRAPAVVRATGWILAAALLFLPLLSPAAVQNAAPALKALIVTGQNANHDWRVSTAALKQILEDTGLFQVDVAESPAPGAKMDGFEPRFAVYRLVVLNYYGDIWPPSTRRAFAAYVKNGGGVVVYHAASIAFPGWPEYNDIIGLGGWSSRNESFGPYVFWKDGKVVRDPQPGIAGYHPRAFTYLVTTRDASHPITAGLPEKWMHAEDELYSLLRGPAANLTVLATALSPFERGGTGREEPILFTVTYGAGRIFHTVLGHAGGERPPALECAGFIVTLQRGAEWAATGKVTQKIPEDFPGTDRAEATPEDVRLWPGYRPPSLDAVLKDLDAFAYSRDEAVLYRLRDYVLAHNKSEAARAACEKKLLGYLESAGRPEAALAVCRALRLIGGEKSVPVLERLLQREETSDMARYALERIPAAEADAALLRSLNTTQGPVRIGIVSALGRRKTAEAVKPLAALVSGQDITLARAAVTALGRIGGAEASAALTEAFGKAEAERRADLGYALLGPVEENLTARNLQAASALCETLLASPPGSLPLPVRRAALEDKILSLEKSEAGHLVLDILTRGPQDLQQPAIRQIPKLFSAAEIRPIGALLPKLTEASQAQLLAVLAGYSGDDVRATVLLAAKSESPLVRRAAITGLARVGDPAVVSFLAERAASAKGAEQAAARSSLWRLPGKDVDAAVLFQLLTTAGDEARSELVQAVAERRIFAGKALLLEKARTGAPRIAAESARALRVIASPLDLPALLEILLESGDSTAQEELRTTIGVVARKIPDPYSRSVAVKRLLFQFPNSAIVPVTDAAKRRLLYRALGDIGDDSSLAILRGALKAEDGDTQDAAVRALAAWPSAAAREDCLAIARGSQNLTHRVLALRGYVRLISLEKYQSPQAAVESLRMALGIATRPEEKTLVLGALPEFACPEALTLAESLAGTEGVQAEAKAAIEKIKEKMGEEPPR